MSSNISFRIIIRTRLILLVHLKSILLNLEIYEFRKSSRKCLQCNVSLDVAKHEQRKMENMLESFIEYNPIRMCIKIKKEIFF